jgi:hypothetical protein
VSLGEVLAWITAGAAIIYQVWDRVAKSRDTDAALAAGLRRELVEDRRRLEAENDRLQKELDDVKYERHRVLDFLADIASGTYDNDWVKVRAATIKARLEGTP